MTERVTKVGVDVVNAGDPKARVTETGISVANTGDPKARVSQATLEAVHTGDPFARVTQAIAEVIHAGDPAAAGTKVIVEVWRSIRDAPYPVFPVRLFNPPTLGVNLRGGTVFGPTTLSGNAAVEAMESTARWAFDFGQVALPTREKMLAWREFVGATDNGVMPCVMTLWDRRHQPVNSRFSGSATIGANVWDDISETDLGFDEVDAKMLDNVDEGTTRIRFSYSAPQPLSGGEHFSIYGSVYNWRLYRIIRVISDENNVVTADIRPPLREWAGQDKRLNFDYPCCIARIDGPLDAALDLLRNGQGVMRLVESDTRYP